MNDELLNKINAIKFNESSREYETAITNIATELEASTALELYTELSTENTEYKLKIYSILFNYNRRLDNINECERLYNTHYNDFKNTFIFNHLYSIILKSSSQEHKIKQSIKLSRKAIENINAYSNPGALHNLADGLLSLCETSSTLSQALKDEYISESLTLLEDVIKMEPSYAKFYATRARAFLLKDDLYSANINIHMAIDKEDSSKKDYTIRINKYSLILSKIETKKSVSGLLARVKEQTDELQVEIRKENLEILSFLIAVISFIFANIQILTKYSLVDAIQLSFAFSSAMLLSVSGFILLYNSKKKYKRFIVVFCISAFMLILSVYIPNLYKKNSIKVQNENNRSNVIKK